MPNSSPVSVGQTAAASQYNDVRKDALFGGHYVATGSSNAFAITADAAYTAYVAGTYFIVQANHTVTGPATLAVLALGAKAIKKLGTGGLVDLQDGDIISGQEFIVIYDGTQFQLQAPRVKSYQGFNDKPLGEDVLLGDRLSLVSGVLYKLRVQVLTTVGSVLTVDSGNKQKVDICKLGPLKALMCWYDSSGARYELAVLSLNKDTLALTEGTNDSSLTDDGSNFIIRVAPLGTDKAVVFYQNSSNNVMAVVATISGTTISLGTPQQVNTTGTIIANDVCQLDTDKCAFVYATTTNVYTRIATVSGTVLTFGTEEADAATFSGEDIRICKSGPDDVCTAAKNSTVMNIRHFTFSGTTLTDAGSANSDANPDTTPFGFDAYDTDKVILAYKESASNNNRFNLFSVSGAPSRTASNTYAAVSNGYRQDIARVGVNRCELLIQDRSDEKIYCMEVLVDGTNVTAQDHEKVQLAASTGAGDKLSAIALLDKDIDGEIRMIYAFNDNQSSTQTAKAAASIEYNNYDQFKGIAAEDGLATESILVIEHGQISGLTGLVANAEVFADPSGYTTSIRPFKIGFASSTTVLEVKVERHPYSVAYSDQLILKGNGLYKCTHGLLVKPTALPSVVARSGGGGESLGFAPTSGVGYSIEDTFDISANLIEAIATAPNVDEYTNTAVVFDITTNAETSLNIRLLLT